MTTASDRFRVGQRRGRSTLEGVVGKRLSVGPVGSGTRHLALRLFALAGIDQRGAELLPLSPEQAGEKLLRGEIDAAAMLTSWDSPVVRKLLADPEIVLAGFPRLEARGAGQDTSDLIARLDDLERRAKRIRVPAFVGPTLYTLRVHVALVRQRLEERARPEA